MWQGSLLLLLTGLLETAPTTIVPDLPTALPALANDPTKSFETRTSAIEKRLGHIEAQLVETRTSAIEKRLGHIEAQPVETRTSTAATSAPAVPTAKTATPATAHSSSPWWNSHSGAYYNSALIQEVEALETNTENLEQLKRQIRERVVYIALNNKSATYSQGVAACRRFTTWGYTNQLDWDINENGQVVAERDSDHFTKGEVHPMPGMRAWTGVSLCNSEQMQLALMAGYHAQSEPKIKGHGWIADPLPPDDQTSGFFGSGKHATVYPTRGAQDLPDRACQASGMNLLEQDADFSAAGAFCCRAFPAPVNREHCEPIDQHSMAYRRTNAQFLALLSIQSIMKKHGLHMFVAQGTLVGLLREGDSMCQDHDIDIYYSPPKDTFPFSDEMKQELEAVPLDTTDVDLDPKREKALEFWQNQCLPASARTPAASLGLSGYRFHLYACSCSGDCSSMTSLMDCGSANGYTMLMNRTSWILWRGFKVAVPWQPFLMLEEASPSWYIPGGASIQDKNANEERVAYIMCLLQHGGMSRYEEQRLLLVSNDTARVDYLRQQCAHTCNSSGLKWHNCGLCAWDPIDWTYSPAVAQYD